MNKWYERASAEERRATFAPLIDLTQRGLLETKVERAYSLGDFREAVAHAGEGKRSGKVIFWM